MNIVTTKVGDKVTAPGTLQLGALFPLDTYGWSLKYIDVLIPSGHTFYFQPKGAPGWQFNGVKIEIISGSGDTHVYRINLLDENEIISNNRPTWVNHEISWDLNQYLFLIGYY